MSCRPAVQTRPAWRAHHKSHNEQDASSMVPMRTQRLTTTVTARRFVRQVLNQIIVSLPEAHPVQENGRPVLRDTLGHTPAQVSTLATQARTHTSLGPRSTRGSAPHALRKAGCRVRRVRRTLKSCRNAVPYVIGSLSLSVDHRNRAGVRRRDGGPVRGDCRPRLRNMADGVRLARIDPLQIHLQRHLLR